MDELIEIFKADFENNHQNREYSYEEGLQMFIKYIADGHPYINLDKVIIATSTKDDVCTFHCINGGSGKDLTEAVNKFLGMVKAEKILRAVTYYDNVRINKIVHFVEFPFQITKINDGIDRTYQLTFYLED